MKNIFTYPNNAPTYVDPNYLGETTTGLRRRITELRNATYLTWRGLSPTHTTDEIITASAKYINYLDSLKPLTNLSMYDFWLPGLIEFTMRAKGVEVKDITLENHFFTDSGSDYNYQKIRVEFDLPHNFVEGERIYIFEETTSELGDIPEFYVEYVDTTNIRLRNVATPSTNPPVKNEYNFTQLFPTHYDTRQWGGELSARALRYDGSGSPGSIVRFTTAPAGWDNNSVVKLMSVFSETHDTGTLRNASQPFYVTRLGGSTFTYEFFTDAAKTTPATLTENYYDQVTKNYTTAGTYDLNNQAFSDWGITDASTYSTDSDGWCRIIATVTQGTFTGNDDSDETIPTTISYSGDFYWDHTNDGVDRFTIYNKRGSGSIVQDFILADAGSGVNVDIEIKFINPARTPAGYAYYMQNNTTDTTARFSEYATPKYEVDQANIYLPSNTKYQYKDVSNVTQNGAKYHSQWFAGGSSATALTGTESLPANSTINLDANGRLSGFTYPVESHDDRGIFDTNTSRLFRLDSLDDQYVPVPQTPAEQQDVFDTDDEWATFAFDVRKEWPRNVHPLGAEIIQSSPNSTTFSQNGVKYVRNSGYTKWQLQVEYPPMLPSDFQKFHGVSQIASTGTPFYFVMVGENNKSILWKDFYRGGTGTTTVRLRESATAEKTVLLFDGFAGFESGAFNRGETNIFKTNQNGNLHTVINTVNANAYGEAKVRIAYPVGQNSSPFDLLYRNPYHVVVTLQQDNFQYTIDTAGFYRVSVTFDLDSFK